MGWLDGLFSWVWGLFASSENKTVKAVRDATRVLCGFLPTVETVLALIAVNPAAATALVIAKKICAAVTAQKPAMLMGGEKPPIIVDGVVIEGEFVEK